MPAGNEDDAVTSGSESTQNVADKVDEFLKGVSKEAVEELTAEATTKNTSTFVPALRYGKVVKVYDGDTIHMVCPILNALDVNDPDKFLTSRFKVRLNNLDTPELRTKNLIEKKYGYEARDVLKEKILNRVVELRNVGYDKYGRILADVNDDDTNLADWLVDQGLAVHYDGGTKHVQDWELLRTTALSKHRTE